MNKKINYIDIFVAVKNDNKVMNFLKALDIKFETLSCNDLNSEIQQFIVQNNKYVINYRNLKTIFVVNDDEKLSYFNNANYDYIITHNRTCVVEYIKSNINMYVKNVLLSDDISCKEEPQSRVFELLQDNNISYENKELLIKKFGQVFYDIDKFDQELYVPLLNNNSIVASWKNILIAYEHYGFDSVKNFIVSNNNIIGEFENVNCVKATTKESFIIDMLNNLATDEIQIICKTLTTSLSLELLNKSEVNSDALAIFINEGKVKYCKTDLQLIFDRLEVLNAYLYRHQNQISKEFDTFFSNAMPVLSSRYNSYGYYVQVPTEQTNSQVIISNVIRCSKVDILIKKTLIEKCKDIINIAGYERIYVDYILKENQIIPLKVLWQFIDVEDVISIDEKKQILIKHLDIEDVVKETEKLHKYIGSFGDNWKDLFVNKELNIEKTDINLQLVHKLKMLNLVTFAKRKNGLNIKIA